MTKLEADVGALKADVSVLTAGLGAASRPA